MFWLLGLLFVGFGALHVWTQRHNYEVQKQLQFQVKSLIDYIVAKNVGEVKLLQTPAISSTQAMSPFEAIARDQGLI